MIKEKIVNVSIKKCLSILLSLIAIFIMHCDRNSSNNHKVSQKNIRASCCDKILVNRELDSNKIELYILSNFSSDIFRKNGLSIRYVEKKNKESLISDYEIYPNDHMGSFMIYHDTINSVETIENFRKNTLKQELFDLPCGKTFGNDSTNFATLIVYLNNKGNESCYACNFSEKDKIPEFRYFFELLEDTAYFKIPLSKLIKVDYKMLKSGVLDTVKLD